MQRLALSLHDLKSLSSPAASIEHSSNINHILNEVQQMSEPELKKRGITVAQFKAPVDIKDNFAFEGQTLKSVLYNLQT
jgi:hypothetical protein